MGLGYDNVHPLVAFPINITTNHSISIGDNYAQAQGNRVLFTGGHYAGNLNAGLWHYHMAAPSNFAHTDVGARILRST